MAARKKYTNKAAQLPLTEEPALAYDSLRIILGGKSSGMSILHDDLDMIRVSREGLQKATLHHLAAYLNISLEQLSGLLHTSYRNLLRKDAGDVLDTYKTEKVLELASFAQRGTVVIGSQEGFADWLQSPLPALGNRQPLEFLDTTFGIQMVLKVLGRLEHGVYA